MDVNNLFTKYLGGEIFRGERFRKISKYLHP